MTEQTIESKVASAILERPVASIELDGVKMTAVVSSLVNYSEGELEGTLSGKTATLYLAEKDSPEGITLGREITFNKERWAVVGIYPQFGMMKLELSRRGRGW